MLLSQSEKDNVMGNQRTKYMGEQFTEPKTQMVYKHIRCSFSLGTIKVHNRVMTSRYCVWTESDKTIIDGR